MNIFWVFRNIRRDLVLLWCFALGDICIIEIIVFSKDFVFNFFSLYFELKEEIFFGVFY